MNRKNQRIKKNTITLLFICILSTAYTQTPFNIQYNYLDFETSLVKTSDGEYATIYPNNYPLSGFSVIKFSMFGDSVWQNILPRYCFDNYLPFISSSDFDGTINLTFSDSLNSYWGIHWMKYDQGGIEISNSFFPVSANHVTLKNLSENNGDFLQPFTIDSVTGNKIPSIMKFNSGGIQWVKRFAFDSSGNIMSARKNINGGYTAFASFDLPNYHKYYKMVRTNSLGDTVWTHNYSETYLDLGSDYFMFSLIDDFGNTTILYKDEIPFVDSIVLIKISSSGNREWGKAYSTNELPFSFNFGSNYEYLIAGRSYNNFPNNLWGSFFSRFDSAGNFLWQKYFVDSTGTNDDPNICSFIETQNNTYAFSGTYGGVGGFSPYSSFIVSTDESGNFPPSINDTLLIAHRKSYSIEALPNPFTDYLFLRATGISGSTAIISVVNILGKIVSQSSVSFSNGYLISAMNLANISKGIYFVSIKTESGFYKIKV